MKGRERKFEVRKEGKFEKGVEESVKGGGKT